MMTISDRTLDILRNMSSLNKGVVFKKGNRIVQKAQGVSNPIMQAIVAEDFPCDFQVYNIDRLIGLADMMEEPQLDIDQIEVVITDKNNRKATIRCANLAVISDPPDYDVVPKLPSVDATFTVDHADWKMMYKSASTVDAPQMAFIGDGKTIRLSTHDVYNPKSKDTFSIEVGTTDRVFNIIFDIALLKMIPDSYVTSVCFLGLIEFKSDDVTYWISASERSTHE